MRLLPLALLLWSSLATAEPSEEELVATVTLTPRLPAAELAAQQLLDKLDREQRFDELLHWTDRMLADPALMHRRDELAETLRQIQRAGLRKRAEKLAGIGNFEACAFVYEVIDDRYNAGICADRAGQPMRALQLFWSETRETHALRRGLQLLLGLPRRALTRAFPSS